MLKATDMLELQKNGIRNRLEGQMISIAQDGYPKCEATKKECPDWLIDELLDNGYKVKDLGQNLNIIWGE